jgi:hypothetical protein
VLKRIFGPKREVVVGSWRKLYSKELHNLYSSSNITKLIQLRRMRWARHLACMGNRHAYIVLVRELEVKNPLRRRTCKWETDIEMDFEQVGRVVR